jgi:hypothetical protein
MVPSVALTVLNVVNAYCLVSTYAGSCLGSPVSLDRGVIWWDSLICAMTLISRGDRGRA